MASFFGRFMKRDSITATNKKDDLISARARKKELLITAINKRNESISAAKKQESISAANKRRESISAANKKHESISPANRKQESITAINKKEESITTVFKDQKAIAAVDAALKRKIELRKKRKESKKSEDPKDLPIHIASVNGNKAALKKIVSTLSKRALEIKDRFGRTPLVLAVSNNHVDCCVVLLKAGANPDNTDNSGQTPLHIAASKGFHKCVKHLLSYNASWIQRDYAGASALHMAASFPNSKGLLLVLKHVKPAEIDIQDSSLKTSLHWAAAYVCNNNIKVLLQRGANSCIPDENGQTPLHWAACNLEIEAATCCKTLLKNKPCLINWQDYKGKAPLHLAISCGCEESVYFLTSWETCNIDIIDNNFLTPLHYAAKRGYAEKADILLKKRASHLSVDSKGAMPLHYAAYNNHAEVCKVFVNKMYISDEPDRYGRSALMWAAARKSDAALKVLATAYVTSTYPDKMGYTALHAAAIYGNASSIEVLVNAGMHIDIKDKRGLTPFLTTCRFGSTSTAQKCLDLGADMNAKDGLYLNGLHFCARGGFAFLASMLLKRGFKSDEKNYFGMTPLHYVSTSGDFVSITCILVESGFNVHTRDKRGMTPLQYAVLKQRFNIVNYLCEQGSNVNAMFRLKKDWATSYDGAVLTSNVKIIDEVKCWGAVGIQEIRDFAARLIWSWYKKRSSNRKAAFSKTVPKSICELCSAEDMKNRGLVFTCDDCYHKYAHRYKRKTSRKSSDNCNVLDAPVYPYKLLEACKKPYTCSGLYQINNDAYKGSLFHVICTETSSSAQFQFNCRNIAATIIQTAWRKYTLRKRFHKVRFRSFVNLNRTKFRRRQEEWKLEMQNFLQNFSD